MSALIAAPRRTVWTALGDPSEQSHWRPGARALLDGPSSTPAPGRVMRLRCLVHEVPIVLEARVLECASEARLRSALRLGLFRAEETFTLRTASRAGGHTRVCLRLATPSEAPLLGGSLDRFAVRRFATEMAAHSLAALRDWCQLGRCETAMPRLDVQLLGHEATRIGEALSREW